jgi:hypothetical protein
MMRVRERRTERERESARARDDAVLLIILRIIPPGQEAAARGKN